MLSSLHDALASIPSLVKSPILFCQVFYFFFTGILGLVAILGIACVEFARKFIPFLSHMIDFGPPAWFQLHENEDINVWLNNQKATINFSFAGALKPCDTLPLRAAANENIALAFNITNSLTTTSPSTHREFLKIASSIINRSDRDWTALFETATSTLTAELTRHPSQPLHLAEATRITCLKVVLMDNFYIADPSKNLPRDSLVMITEQINKQWLKAKTSAEKPTSSPLLTRHLNVLGLKHRSLNTFPKPEEVLSIIMPQYETLWRVVMATYLLAFHLYPSPTLAARLSPVPGCLGTKSPEENEALKLAKEGLRLTPSNKRIYRHTPSPSSQTIKADLELMHRHPYIWGPSALEFNPYRFDNLTPLQREAYLPYSLRPHRCPAFGGFGDRMVTCLVVAMGRVLDTTTAAGKVFDKDWVDGKAETEREWVDTGRDGLEGWRYQPAL
ncbi:hypothetical protein QBC41DRAFT_222623 [Cercophora samala]|uniref:Cytochrome P450 n=1 Tax=Cercophora samala TaxID=330535 RepID=A0AA39ZFG9_9PEZI|nr:hypothetical protein QBC41DRAFT_222623 [Cercophora samala]